MAHYSKSQIFVQKFNFDKTPTFSRVFHPKNQQFSREIKVEFSDKKWRFRTVCNCRLTRNSTLLNGNGPFWTTRIRMASMINQRVIWIKKKLMGSHWKRKDTAQAVSRPKIIHSVKGSIKMEDGIMAERNLAHLQWQKKDCKIHT